MGTGPQYTISQLNQDGVLEAVGPNNPLYISGGGGGGAVDSVNGQTGVVVLDAEDVGAVPSAEGDTYRVYGTDTSGVNTTFLLEGLNPLPVTVPMRTETGAVVTATPTANNHAATKEYVDSGFLTKPAPFTGAARLYYLQSNGNTGAIRYGYVAIADYVVQRDYQGQISTILVPTDNSHVTSKQYVDLRVPVPPATGTYTLQSVDGVTSWVAVAP